MYNLFERVVKLKDFRKYSLNENYFSKLNHVSAYFLGFIAADGHITNYIKKQNHLIINIIESDREILENIKNQLVYNGKIYNVPKNNGQNQVSIRICSNKLKNDINEYINTNNKTFDLQWCKNISDKLIIDFIRGYFDGDGCVHFNKIKSSYSASIVGTENFLSGLKSFYNQSENNEVGSIKIYKTYSHLVFGGKYVANNFLEWLYKDSTEETRLSRKYKKYLELAEYVGDDPKPHNNQKIDQELADNIRSLHQTISAKDISSRLNVPLSTIYDVLSNRTWFDENYVYQKSNQETIYLTYNDKTLSLTDWSKEVNIPKSTLDRRFRQGLSIEQIFSTDKKLYLGKQKSKKDLESYKIAKIVRDDFKNGIVGKSNYEKNKIPKSRYTDLIGNRTCKEEVVWWR
jgi:predicted transcriptional regulator